jgi:hypothetical protein
MLGSLSKPAPRLNVMMATSYTIHPNQKDAIIIKPSVSFFAGFG